MRKTVWLCYTCGKQIEDEFYVRAGEPERAFHISCFLTITRLADIKPTPKAIYLEFGGVANRKIIGKTCSLCKKGGYLMAAAVVCSTEAYSINPVWYINHYYHIRCIRKVLENKGAFLIWLQSQ